MSRLLQLLRLLAVEVSQGVGLIGGLLTFTAALLVSSLAGVSELTTGWSDTFNLSLTGSVFLCPLAAGIAAINCQSMRRRGVLELAATTPAGESGSVLLAGAATLIWQIASFGTMVVILALRIGSRGPLSRADVSLVILAGLVLVACTLIGTAVGSELRSALAPPLFSVAVFAWMFVASYLNGWLSALSPIYPAVYYQPFLEPRLALVSAQVAVAVGVIILALGRVARRSRTLSMLSIVGAAISLSGVLAIYIVGPRPVQYRSPPDVAACVRQQGTRLCAWPVNSEALVPAVGALVRVRSAADPVLQSPNTYGEAGLRGADAGVRQISVPGKPTSPVFYYVNAIQAVLPPLKCGSSLPTSALDAHSQLVQWLEARLGLNASLAYMSRGVAEVATAPVSEQRQWVASRVRRVHACTA